MSLENKLTDWHERWGLQARTDIFHENPKFKQRSTDFIRWPWHTITYSAVTLYGFMFAPSKTRQLCDRIWMNRINSMAWKMYCDSDTYFNVWGVLAKCQRPISSAIRSKIGFPFIFTCGRHGVESMHITCFGFMRHSVICKRTEKKTPEYVKMALGKKHLILRLFRLSLALSLPLTVVSMGQFNVCDDCLCVWCLPIYYLLDGF